MRQLVRVVCVPPWEIHPVELLGRPGSITRSQRSLPGPLACPITGNTVRSPVIGL